MKVLWVDIGEHSMPEVTREAVFESVLGIVNKLADDWEYSGTITPQTRLVEDLGLESIDVVVLGTTLQNHYNCALPFAEFLVEIGRRQVRDVRIEELVDFVYRHLNTQQP